MKKYSYVNCGDYSKELFKTGLGGTVNFNITQWKYICPKCKHSEIVEISKTELEEINKFTEKQNGN